MIQFETHTIKSAPQASRPLMEKTQQAFGFIPNLIGMMAEAPALAEGYLTLSGIFDQTSFDATERQVILLATSRFNRCQYCMGAHSGIAAMQGTPDAVIEALRNDTPIPDPKLEALRVFTTQVVELRGWVDEATVEAFLEAGYGRQQVLEVIVGVGLKTLSNYANHIAGTELDAPFESAAWTE